ncbi:hypothetical protein, partial [Corallococcus exercitus]
VVHEEDLTAAGLALAGGLVLPEGAAADFAGFAGAEDGPDALAAGDFSGGFFFVATGGPPGR